jgi:hypothetical protein
MMGATTEVRQELNEGGYTLEEWRKRATAAEAKLAAVPVEAILALRDGTPRGGWIVPHLDTVEDWLFDVCPGQLGPKLEPD